MGNLDALSNKDKAVEILTVVYWTKCEPVS